MGILSGIASAVSRAVSSITGGGSTSKSSTPSGSTGSGTAAGAHDTAQSRAIANHTDRKSSTPSTQNTQANTGGGSTSGKTIQPTYVSGGAGGSTYRVTDESGKSYQIAVSGISLEEASKYYAEKAASTSDPAKAAEYARSASDFSAAANYEKESGILKNYGTGTGITYDATASLMYDEYTGKTYLDDTALMYPAGKGSLGGEPVQTLAAKQYAPSNSWAKTYQNPADDIPHTLGGAVKDGEIFNDGIYIGLPEQGKTANQIQRENLGTRGEVQSNVLDFINNRIFGGLTDNKNTRTVLEWREQMYDKAAKYEEEGDYIKWALTYIPTFLVDCVPPLDALETARKLNDGEPVEQYELDIASVDLAISCIPIVGAGVKAIGKIVTRAGEKAALNVAEEAGEKAALNAGEKTALNTAEEAGEKAAKNAAEETGEKAGKTTLSRAVGIGTTAASVGGTLLQFSLYPDDEGAPGEGGGNPDEYDDTDEYDENPYPFFQPYEEQYGEFGGIFGGGGSGADPFTAAISAGIDADTDQIIQTYIKPALIAAVILLILIVLNVAVSKKGVKKHHG